MVNDKWFTVVVGNVGTVYHGQSKKDAKRTYADYVRISKSGNGRAAHESVTMMNATEILESHYS